MQKKVGRPSKGGPGTLLQSRWDDEALARLDDWRRQQPDLPSRTEALRRLVSTHPDIAKAIREATAAGLEAEAQKKKGGKK